MENETHKTEILDNQIMHFHHVLHPAFLLSGLESILLRLHEKQFEKADDGILLLAEIYRYLLKQHDELIPLEEEIQVIKKIESFLLHYSPYYVKIEFSVSDQSSLVVPRTLVRLLESVASSQLSSKHAPLVILLEETDGQVVLSFPSNFSLINGEKLYKMLEEVRLQYSWLGRELRWEDTGYFKIFIPTAKSDSIITIPEQINQQVGETENYTGHIKKPIK
ncbi:histidine kinase [Pontibacter toksunensis]|uniref:Histidine kinase n=1 Tax=Pontibacter toksunensis TaxID=1332631 RepID=A0ABW6C6M0_9BACT